MTPDWNAIRLDLLGIDEPMRASLREMRPFFAKALPAILGRFYDKVRQYDPSSGIFKDGAMQESIRLQLQHWDLIGAADFSLPYLSSVARFCEFNQRARVAPQWYVGCRLMFIADQLTKAVEAEVEMPRYGRTAQAAARDKRMMMQNVIADDRPEIGLSVVVLRTADNKAEILRVLAPLGVLLPNGLGLNVDGKDIGRAYFVRCFQDGCYAEVILEKPLIDTLSTGQAATFIVFQTPEEGIGIPVDLKGFGEGFAALPR